MKIVSPISCTLSYGLRWRLQNETWVCHSHLFLAFQDMVLTKKKRPTSPPSTPSKGFIPLGAPQTAAIQQRTRQQHAQERGQDYVEAIADLIQACGEARATDLAKSLGVTHVTVIRTVQRLQREDLVTTHPYRSIFLTEAGRKLAAKAKDRHEKVVAFLEALGISPSVARLDAEGIEHHVSPETLAAFEKFMTRASSAQHS
jgi:DtxR family manganese transport transcriptional regulator